MEDIGVQGQVLRQCLVNLDRIVRSLEVLQDKQNIHKFDQVAYILAYSSEMYIDTSLLKQFSHVKLPVLEKLEFVLRTRLLAISTKQFAYIFG